MAVRQCSVLSHIFSEMMKGKAGCYKVNEKYLNKAISLKNIFVIRKLYPVTLWVMITCQQLEQALASAVYVKSTKPTNTISQNIGIHSQVKQTFYRPFTSKIGGFQEGYFDGQFHSEICVVCRDNLKSQGRKWRGREGVEPYHDSPTEDHKVTKQIVETVVSLSWLILKAEVSQ